MGRFDDRENDGGGRDFQRPQSGMNRPDNDGQRPPQGPPTGGPQGMPQNFQRPNITIPQGAPPPQGIPQGLPPQGLPQRPINAMPTMPQGAPPPGAPIATPNPAMATKPPGMKKGGTVKAKCMAKGGVVKSKSSGSRGDGIASRGRTNCKYR